MKIINTHAHLTKKASEGVKKGDINDLLDDMEKGGISKSLIISVFGKEDVDYSLKELLDISKRNKRIKIIYTVDINKNLKTQEKEVEFYFKKKLIKGIKILLGYQRIMPDNKKLISFYKLCEKYGYPVIFHTGDSFGADAKLKYSHPLNIDSLAVDIPKLKIIMAHIGNPWILDAAEIIYKNPNVYGDLSGFFLNFNDKRYNQFIRNKVNEFIAFAGGEKLLFGTDFPLADSVNYINFVKSLNLTKKEIELTFHKNAEKLFKLK